MHSVDIDKFAEVVINYACGLHKLNAQFNTWKNAICKKYEKHDTGTAKFHNSTVKEIICENGVLIKTTQKNKTYMYKATKKQAEILRAYFYVHNLDKIIAKEHVDHMNNMPWFVYTHWIKFNENIKLLLDATQVYT